MDLKNNIDYLLICAESVLNFLKNSGDEFRKTKDFNTPSLIFMRSKLKVIDTDMSDFTIMLNNKYFIYNNPLWVDTPREFFNNNKAILFYERVIKIMLRKKKINKLKK